MAIENFETLLNEYSFGIKKDSIINAVIVEVKRDLVILDLGFKSVSPVDKKEFLTSGGEFPYNRGDEVEVYVEEIDDGTGEMVLSRSRCKEISAWDKINKSLKDNVIVKAYVEKVVRGGLLVNIDGMGGFLPNSLVEKHPVPEKEAKEFTKYLNQVIEVKVIKIVEDTKAYFVSRKSVLENTNHNTEEIMKNLNVGSVVKAIVKNITDYGVFCEIGGVDGLLHITDMSWKRIDTPHSMFKLGDAVDLKITKIDPNNGKISLSLKELNDSPWVNLVQNHKEGDVVKGVVSKVTDYGAFVNLDIGLEGLIHNTELDWNNKNASSYEKFEVGQEVSTKIVEIDNNKHRVSLSYKRMESNPWETFGNENAVGDKVSCVVKSVNDAGVIVNLGNQIEGLIPVENCSWNPRFEIAATFKAGNSVEAVIKTLEPMKERLILSIKDLQKDPLVDFQKTHKVGSKVRGTVVDVSIKNITLKLSENIFGQIKHAEAGVGYESLKDNFKVGEEVDSKIVGFSNKYVNLSLKELVKDFNEK